MRCHCRAELHRSLRWLLNIADPRSVRLLGYAFERKQTRDRSCSYLDSISSEETSLDSHKDVDLTPSIIKRTFQT